MASSQLPPSNKTSAAPAATIIRALGDDLLREVFLRLPSLPSLVRAALTCPAFLRAARSSPAFRRRFRDLHPAPLLGFFLYIADHAMPAFMPVRRWSDPDHAATVRGADVFLTRVPEDEGEWSMRCRGGHVVLFHSLTHRLVIYDPLSRRLHLLNLPLEDVFAQLPDEVEVELEFHVVTSEEDHRSLRVICICMEGRAPRVAAFSPDTREWQISSEAGSLQLPVGDIGTAVNGCVYWASEYDIHVLNAATLHFSRIDPPPYVQVVGVKVGETSDGKLCVAWATAGLTLEVWVRRATTSGTDEWMLDTDKWMLNAIDKLELPFEDEFPELEVVAIIRGIVYLSTYVASRPSSRWFLSFCTETEELEMVCPITGSSSPYFMAWPPVLHMKIDEQDAL